MSSPLSVVVFVVFLVVILSKPSSPLLAKVPKRFPLLISFPSSSSHRRDDFPPPPPREEREEEEEERDKGEQGDATKGLLRPPFQVRRMNTLLKTCSLFLLVVVVVVVFPCVGKVCGFGLSFAS